MNTWGIPKWLEQEVRARDKNCIYCGVEMTQNLSRGCSRKTAATWEHIVNDARIITRDNIALCCSPCNSSKGAKLLSEWVQSPYCTIRGINADTVAQIVKNALQQPISQPAIKAPKPPTELLLDLRPGGRT